MLCRKCGARLRKKDVFCSKCGVCVAPSEENIQPLHEDSVLDFTQLNNNPAEKNKKVIIAVCVAAVTLLVAVLVAAVIHFSGNTGDKLLAAGNYEKAAEEYEAALEKDAENTEIRTKLAGAYIELKEYDDAIETLEYIFRYADGNSEVYELLLIACAGEHEDSLANKHYEDAKLKGISFNLKKTGYAIVPDIVDLSLEKARKNNSIKITEKEWLEDEAEADTILEQSPEGGTIGRLAGDKVKVYVTVSDGPGDSVMRDYQGADLSEIKAELGDGHLIELEDEGSNTVEKGKIVRTIPAAGETLEKNAVITVYISSGEKIVSVPKITGKTLEQANGILSNVNLGIGSVTYEPSSKAEGTVIRQTPAYKSKVSADTYIDVVISGGE